MAKLTLLDTTKTGKHAQDLESKLRRLVVGQDEAIQEVVTAYQRHMMGLSPASRPIVNLRFSGRPARGRRVWWRRPRRPC